MITAKFVNRRLAEGIREARAIAGLTQQQVADRTELTRASVANLEFDMQAVTVHQLILLGRALSVDPVSLMPPLNEVDMHDPDGALIARKPERVAAALAT